MTISQPRPPPLPMCSSPHGVASPAQSRPALRNPPALPRPPRRTTPPPPSQVHDGLKAAGPITGRRSGNVGEPGGKPTPGSGAAPGSGCTSLEPVRPLPPAPVRPPWPPTRPFFQVVVEPSEDRPEAGASEAILCPNRSPCFSPQSLKVTPKTVGRLVTRSETKSQQS